MTTINQMTTINELFTQFLSEHGSQDMVQEWKKEEYQEKLKELLPKATKASGKKDPNKPKGCKSSYIFFCGDHRTEVKNDLGDVNAKEITAELGRRWNALKESTKAGEKKKLAKYEEQAQADKERYLAEMEGYEPQSDGEGQDGATTKKGKKASGKKDPNKPKRGKSSYIFFCAEHREEAKKELGPEAKATEVTIELGRMWNALKASDKASDKQKFTKYEAQAQADKERYLAELAGYESLSDEEGEPKTKDDQMTATELTPPPAEQEKSSAKKSSGKKMTGYNFFCKENRAQVKEANPDAAASAVTKILAGMWKGLDEDDQVEWKARAADM